MATPPGDREMGGTPTARGLARRRRLRAFSLALLLTVSAAIFSLAVAHASSAPAPSESPDAAPGGGGSPSSPSKAAAAGDDGDQTDAPVSAEQETAEGKQPDVAPPEASSEGPDPPGSSSGPADGGGSVPANPGKGVRAPAYPTLPDAVEPTAPLDPEGLGEGAPPLLAPDGSVEPLLEPPLTSLAEEAEADKAASKSARAVKPAALPDDPGELCSPDAPDACQDAARAYVDFVRALDKLIESCPTSLEICRELRKDPASTPEELEQDLRGLVTECVNDLEFCAEFAPLLVELTGALDEVAATCERDAAACQQALCEDLEFEGCPRAGRPPARPRGSSSLPAGTPGGSPTRPASLSTSGVLAARLPSTSETITADVSAADADGASPSTLPFTGFPVLALALLGLVMALTGAGLLRRYS